MIYSADVTCDNFDILKLYSLDVKNDIYCRHDDDIDDDDDVGKMIYFVDVCHK